jgi:hypothetical protein
VVNKEEDYLHEWHDRNHPDYVHPQYWGVSLADILHFKKEVKKNLTKIKDMKMENRGIDLEQGEDDPDIGPCMYKVNERYIMPDTKEIGCSWALKRNGQKLDKNGNRGLVCEAFATHAWIEGVFEFCYKIKRAWPHKGSRCVEVKGCYVCFLSNPQNGNLKKMLDCEIQHTPFYCALTNKECFVMIVIGNDKKTIYSRLWCVYEAHVAMELCNGAAKLDNFDVNRKKFRIVLPWKVDCQQTLWLWLAVLCFIPSYLFGFHQMFKHIGPLCGPVMWLIVANLSGAACQWFVHQLLLSMERNAWLGIRGVSRVTYAVDLLELFLMGVAAGMAFRYIEPKDAKWYWPIEVLLGTIATDGFQKYQSHLTEVGKQLLLHRNKWSFFRFNIRWEYGEGTSVFQVLVCLLAVYCSHVFGTLRRDVVKSNGQHLDEEFTSVRNADCTDDFDAKNIKQAIAEAHGGSAEKAFGRIDMNIKRLVEVGRFNEHISQNMDLGMSADKAARGVIMMKIPAGVFTWLFWLDTDLAGSGHRHLANVLPLSISVIIAVLVMALPNVRSLAVFAIDAFMWMGCVFLFVSNSPLAFKQEAVENFDMKRSSLVVLVPCFILMILIDIYHYCGFRKRILEYMRSDPCMRSLIHLKERSKRTQELQDFNEMEEYEDHSLREKIILDAHGA